jgi:hypothetical protein
MSEYMDSVTQFQKFADVTIRDLAIENEAIHLRSAH